MFDWFYSLSLAEQWIVGILIAPVALYLVGLITITFEPSAAADMNGKAGCILGPMILGAVVLGYLGSIYKCTVFLESVVDLPFPSFIIGLPLGMFLFTMALWLIPMALHFLVTRIGGTFKRKN